MKFSVSRDDLLRPQHLAAGVVERRQTLPVLANVLIVLEGDRLTLTGTDSEVEVVARLKLSETGESGETTVSARKLVDIVRSLPDGATIQISESDNKLILKSGHSRFSLSTLPSTNFPNVEASAAQLEFSCAKQTIKQLIDSTAFAMAHQDVRYYLNGMLWEIQPGQLRCVATDGHRLAMCTKAVEVKPSERVQVIVPRKGVLELSRMLDDDGDVTVAIGDKHIQVNTPSFSFTSKLVDGKFPDYERVLPRGGKNVLIGDREEMKQAFSRSSILSNEKYRGVRLTLTDGLMTLVANNPEQDEAEEQVLVDYHGDALEIGFNVGYLLDIANAIKTDKLQATFVDADTSALVEEPEGGDVAYVIMPMRL